MRASKQLQRLHRRAMLRCVATGIGLVGLQALTACSAPFATPTPIPTPQPQQIVLWNWLDTAGAEITRQFEQQNPLITVKVESISYERAHQQLISSLKSGTGAPDLFITDLTYLGILREQEGLADLSGPPFDGSTLKQDFIPNLWNYATFNGQQIALPWIAGVGLGWYRPDILAAAGLPSEPEEVQQAAASWDSWLALDQALRRANPKTALIGAAADLFPIRVEQQGHGWVDGEKVLIEEKGQAAAALVAAARDNDVPPTSTGRQLMREIVSGQLAGMVDASWMQLFLTQDALQTGGKWRVVRAPGGDYLTSGLYMLIPQQSAKQEAAWSFIRYLCASAEGQNSAFKTTGAFPSYRQAWDDPVYDQPSDFFGGQFANRLMLQAVAQLPAGTISAHDGEIDQITQRAAAKIAKDGLDPQQAMAEAETEALAQLPGLTR